MANSNKILVLGGTGRLGLEVIRLALAKGFSVVTIARTADKLAPFISNYPKQLEILLGDVTSPALLKPAAKNALAVVNCLNISRKNDFPWSALRAPTGLLTDTTGALLPLLHKKQRLISVSAIGVGDSAAYTPKFWLWLVKKSNIRYAYRAHEAQEQLIQNGSKNYTIVRPTGLTASRSVKKVRLTDPNGRPKPRAMMSRASVAAFILDVIENGGFQNETVTIS